MPLSPFRSFHLQFDFRMQYITTQGRSCVVNHISSTFVAAMINSMSTVEPCCCASTLLSCYLPSYSYALFAAFWWVKVLVEGCDTSNGAHCVCTIEKAHFGTRKEFHNELVFV
eukprot:10666195-Ditylum_brightwellii.AAC.1